MLPEPPGRMIWTALVCKVDKRSEMCGPRIERSWGGLDRISIRDTTRSGMGGLDRIAVHGPWDRTGKWWCRTAMAYVVTDHIDVRGSDRIG